MFVVAMLHLHQCDANSFVVRTRRQAANSGSTQMNVHQFRRWGNLSVGTPAKSFQVAFNLQSTDFWLIDVNATIDESDRQRKKIRYDSSQSTTASSLNRSFKFTSGPVGQLYTDIVSIAGIQVPSVPFGSASGGVPSQYLRDRYDALCPIDGQFGLSPSAGTTDQNISSPLNALTNALSKPVLTVYTTGVTIGGQNLGSITFGAENTVNCVPAYSYVPLAEPGQWVVGLQSVLVGGQKLAMQLSPKLKVLEDGLYMNGPKAQMDKLARKLGANVPTEIGSFYTLPRSKCDNMQSMPNVTIVVGQAAGGGKMAQVVLAPKHYMEVSATGDCRLLFMDNESMSYDNQYFNMGQQFLFNRCVALNWVDGTMGFAAAAGKN